MIFAIPIFSRLSIFTFTAVIILARDNTKPYYIKDFNSLDYEIQDHDILGYKIID